MSRAVVILNADADRRRVAHWAMGVPWGTRVEFKEVKRTLPQNARMWAMLTDVATQTTHGGRRYTTDEWKALFMHACGQEVRFLEALDHKSFVPFGFQSSDLSVKEMTDLIEYMFMWGAEHGVVFHERDPQPERGGPDVVEPAIAASDSATGPPLAAPPRSGTHQ